jgi:hypothetical protein
MRRFFEAFEICQPLASESAPAQILQTLPRVSVEPEITPRPTAESSPDRICYPLANRSVSPQTLQPVAGESSGRPIRQAAAAESVDRITIGLAKHRHLGWTHGSFFVAARENQYQGTSHRQHPSVTKVSHTYSAGWTCSLAGIPGKIQRIGSPGIHREYPRTDGTGYLLTRKPWIFLGRQSDSSRAAPGEWPGRL